MIDEPGLVASDPSRAARLAKVLAWETGSNEINVTKCLKIANVRQNLR
jgi:hypothetical protein